MMPPRIHGGRDDHLSATGMSASCRVAGPTPSTRSNGSWNMGPCRDDAGPETAGLPST